MIYLFDFILVFVALFHCLKHIQCPRYKYCVNGRCCVRRSLASDEESFGAYPILFCVYALLQLFFALCVTFVYLYDAILENVVQFEHDDDNIRWNDTNMIPRILLFPFPIGRDASIDAFTFFKAPQFSLPTLANRSSLLSDLQQTPTIVSIAVMLLLFLIYAMEGFLHWYRFYTLYVAHKRLKDVSFGHVLRTYAIYMVLQMVCIVACIFVQNYSLIVVVLIHMVFNIWCSNQQIKVLLKSTSSSLSDDQAALLMSPLYAVRRYSIASILVSSVFLLLLIVSDTITNSMLYYPMFACFNSLLLSFIYVRNRPCARARKKKNSVSTASKSSVVGYNTPTASTKGKASPIHFKSIKTPTSGARSRFRCCGKPTTQLTAETATPSPVSPVVDGPDKQSPTTTTPTCAVTPSPVPGVYGSHLIHHSAMIGSRTPLKTHPSLDEDNTTTQLKTRSRKGSKVGQMPTHMSPEQNMSLDPTEIYNSLFPSTREMSENHTVNIYDDDDDDGPQIEQERTPIAPPQNSTYLQPAVLRPMSLQISTAITPQLSPQISARDSPVMVDEPDAPKNTPTLNNGGGMLLPTDIGSQRSIDDDKMSAVIQKLNGIHPSPQQQPQPQPQPQQWQWQACADSQQYRHHYHVYPECVPDTNGSAASSTFVTG